MSDTQVLLTKIAAVRQQLEKAQASGKDPGSSTVTTLTADPARPGRLWRLERQVTAGSEHAALLDGSLRQLAEPQPAAPDPAALPRQLTSRARSLLVRGRELLTRLRDLADEPLVQQDEGEPLTLLFRETTAVTATALRMVQAFPDAPSSQLRLCEGVEAILRFAAERLALLCGLLEERGREQERVGLLADFLTMLHAGDVPDIQPLVRLAEALLAEAQEAAPLRFLAAPAADPARFVACHGLTTAQVIARVVRHDPELRAAPVEPVLAALLHDAGMLAVPAAVLAHPGPLDDAQGRAVEGHVRRGAELAQRLLPSGPWLAEAVLGHHERLDGTGYPAGARELQVPPLARLLAVADVYAARNAPRPHRPAADPRTALTDTLALAEKGGLDRARAEHLLHLSFYPVGSVVELADGAVGAVVVTHGGQLGLPSLARPVLALLTDGDGRLLPAPEYVDLAQTEGRSIVRALGPADRRALLGRCYPQWA